MRNYVTVTALRSFDGHAKGDVFPMPTLDALKAAKRRDVSVTRGAKVTPEPAVPPPSPAVGSLELESEAPEALIKARRGRPPKPRE